MDFHSNDCCSMILTSENKVLTINGKVIERKVNSLSFRVRGSKFPNWNVQRTTSQFIFFFNKPQSVTVNWGDGTISTHNSSFYRGANAVSWVPDYVVDANALPTRVYADSNTADRIITFNFDDLSKITDFRTSGILIEGAFPDDIKYCYNLNSLILGYTEGITSFPNKLSSPKLKTLRLQNVYPTKQTKIPDSFFDLNLEILELSGSYNCSALVSSNLFKLNTQTNLLQLRMGDCNIVSLGENFKELTKLEILTLTDNPFTAFPIEIEKLINLKDLQISVLGTNVSFIDFKDLNKITRIYLIGNFNLSEIPLKWVGLNSLNLIQLTGLVNNSLVKNNLFIDNFYELCTTNGSITASTSNYGGVYPDRFRSIAWGDGTMAFTGAKVAPAGYVQGVSNGTPTTQGHKVYILQNQYNHTITHA